MNMNRQRDTGQPERFRLPAFLRSLLLLLVVVAALLLLLQVPPY